MRLGKHSIPHQTFTLFYFLDQYEFTVIISLNGLLGANLFKFLSSKSCVSSLYDSFRYSKSLADSAFSDNAAREMRP